MKNRVSWTTLYLGTFHADVPSDEVNGFVGSLHELGFEPTVEVAS